MDITEPAIDREPGKPEVYYFDHPTRARVLEKRGETTPAKPAPKPKKATKKASKKG